jgi:hypothetical protein
MPDTRVMNDGLGTVLASNVQVTPAGGVTGPLSSFLNGGTVAAGGALTQFSSITPAGSNQATGTPITSVVTVLGTAASTTGSDLPPGTAAPIGIPLLLLNQGTAAVHLYSGNTVDTIDGTAGTTGVSLTNAHRCFFTQVSNNGTTGIWVSGPEGGVTS